MEVKSIKELIEMKNSINKEKEEIKEIYCESLGTAFKYRKVTRPELVQLNKLDIAEQDAYLIYTHVVEPDLSNKELQDAYNKGKKPHLIVDELIPHWKDVGKLSAAILDNEKNVDLIKDIKNF